MLERFDFDLVAIAPHPDDAELFCGGVLALAGKRGQKTAIIDLTRGELSSRGTPEEREKESNSAAKVLQLALRRNLGMPDGSLAVSDESIKSIVKLLRELRPKVLLLPHGAERHPDHVAAHDLCTKAVFLSGLKKFEPKLEAFAPNAVLYYQQRVEFQPTFLTDISSVWETKIQALKSYKSQFEPSESSARQVLVGLPLNLPAIEARDRHLGAHIGVAYAEGFLTRHAINITDPVQFFSVTDHSKALYFNS